MSIVLRLRIGVRFETTHIHTNINWRSHTVFAADPALTGLIAGAVQCFFAWRVKVISSKPWSTVFILVCSFVGTREFIYYPSRRTVHLHIVIDSFWRWNCHRRWYDTGVSAFSAIWRDRYLVARVRSSRRYAYCDSSSRPSREFKCGFGICIKCW